jgi:hypothetical protein
VTIDGAKSPWRLRSKRFPGEGMLEVFDEYTQGRRAQRLHLASAIQSAQIDACEMNDSEANQFQRSLVANELYSTTQ